MAATKPAPLTSGLRAALAVILLAILLMAFGLIAEARCQGGHFADNLPRLNECAP